MLARDLQDREIVVYRNVLAKFHRTDPTIKRKRTTFVPQGHLYQFDVHYLIGTSTLAPRQEEGLTGYVWSERSARKHLPNINFHFHSFGVPDRSVFGCSTEILTLRILKYFYRGGAGREVDNVFKWRYEKGSLLLIQHN